MGLRLTPARVAALALARYQLPAPTADTFPSITAFNTMLNAGMRKFYAACVEQYGHLYLERIQTFTLTPPAYAVQLPTDFVRLVDGPYVSEDNKTYGALRSAERGFEALIPGSEQGQPAFYLLSQGALTFAPRPDKLLYIRMRYLALPGDVDFQDDVTIIEGPPGWDDYVASYLCVQLAAADRKELAPWAAMYKDAKDELIKALAPQDDNAVVTVTDVYDTWAPQELGTAFWRRTRY